MSVKLAEGDRNRRQNFRQDDVLFMKEEVLSEDQFEVAKHHPGVDWRQAEVLQTLARTDSLNRRDSYQDTNPELSTALELFEVKLNYLIGMNAAQQSDHSDLEERVVNISAMGMQFTTEEHYKQGERLKITLSLALFPPMILDVLAEIVRLKAVSNDKAKVGVLFLYRCEEEEEVVTRYVYKRQRETIRVKCRQ